MEGTLAGFHQLFIDAAELLLLVLPPNKSLYRPDGGEALLHHIVELVHGLLKPPIHGGHLTHYKKEDQSQNGSAHHKNEGQPGIHPEGQTQAHYQHHRAAHQRPQAAVDGVLKHRHIGGHTGNQRGTFKFIQIGKPIALDPLVLGFSDISSPAVGRPGCKTGIQQTGHQSQQRTHPHLNSLPYNIMQVLVLHTHINQVGHQHRNHKLKGCLNQHQQAAHQQVPTVGTQIGQ